jgi:hypothetical protein
MTFIHFEIPALSWTLISRRPILGAAVGIKNIKNVAKIILCCCLSQSGAEAPLQFRNFGILDHFGPFRDVGLKPRLDLLGRSGLGLDPEIEQPLLDFG